MDFTMTIVWLIALVVLLFIEFVTMGLTTIWFAGGALVATVIAACDGPLWLQIICFAVVSILMLIFTRPIAAKYFNNRRVKTNVEDIIGRQVTVKERIDNVSGTGVVMLNGSEWSARSADDAVYEETAILVIRAVKGVTLIVSDKN